MTELSDFEFEPVHGLPEKLPAGEQILWQGSPNGYRLAIEALHARKVAVYFLLLLCLNLYTLYQQGSSLETFMSGAGMTLVLAFAALFILGGLAWLMASATVYTLTSERLCIRFGIALQLTLNLPFSQITSASLRLSGNGYGNIPVSVVPNERMSYLVLWPHVRPWYWRRPQPMLRTIPEASQVAALLAEAVSQAASRRSDGTSTRLVRPTPAMTDEQVSPMVHSATSETRQGVVASTTRRTERALPANGTQSHRCHS